jgi:putative flippase GtrA
MKLGATSRRVGGDFGRLLRFGAVGIATAVLYLIFSMSIGLLTESLPFASAIAFTLAVTAQFHMHKHFTFSSAGARRGELGKFVLTILVGCILSWLIVWTGERLELPDIVSLLAVIVVTPIVNWFSFNLWVFKSGGGHAP